MFDEEADVVIKCGGGASDGGPAEVGSQGHGPAATNRSVDKLRRVADEDYKKELTPPLQEERRSLF